MRSYRALWSLRARGAAFGRQFCVLDGPSKAVSIAEILRQWSLGRVETRLFIRPRPTTSPRFHEHLARSNVAEDVVEFSQALKRQNSEDRSAARRQDWCPACETGKKVDVWG